MRHSLVISMSFLPALAIAEVPPDAGALRQQIEQNREPALAHKVLPQKAAEPQVLHPHSGLIFTVKAFRFAGNAGCSIESAQQSVSNQEI
jgi:hypothetical protein